MVRVLYSPGKIGSPEEKKENVATDCYQSAERTSVLSPLASNKHSKKPVRSEVIRIEIAYNIKTEILGPYASHCNQFPCVITPAS